MPAHPWELRADVRPLETAAQRWSDLGTLMARRGDDLVEAALRATDGWEAAAAESFAEHRREVLANLDRFTTLAARIAGSLCAVSAVLTSTQRELDRAWTTVAMVPHETVGESRHLVFKPAEDDDRSTVARGQAEAEEIRRRLTLALDQESTRLRAARAELVTVRIELMTLTSGRFPGIPGPAHEVSGEVSGVGSVPPPASTSVHGASQAGVSALPPIAPIAVSTPDLTGISTGGIGPLAGAAVAAALRRTSPRASSGQAVPPIGGMGAGAMAARAGTMSRGTASGRGGPSRLPAPRLERASSEEAAGRAARDKEAVREAKRAALEEKRTQRAARRAEREAARATERDTGRKKARDSDDEEDRPPVEVVHEPAPEADPGDGRR